MKHIDKIELIDSILMTAIAKDIVNGSLLNTDDETLEMLLHGIWELKKEFQENIQSMIVNMNEDESPNGHAHLQHLLLGTSETVPVMDGALQFGAYQSS